MHKIALLTSKNVAQKNKVKKAYMYYLEDIGSPQVKDYLIRNRYVKELKVVIEIRSGFYNRIPKPKRLIKIALRKLGWSG